MVAVASVLLVAFTVACGGSATKEAGDDAEVQPTESPRETVGVRLVDFEIELDPDAVAAGTITFEVQNDGFATDDQGKRIPSASGGMHNLHVLRTDLPPDDLPHLAADSLIVDTRSPEIESLAYLPTLEDGATKSLTLDLAIGGYLLICNAPSHYARGMWTELSVG